MDTSTLMDKMTINEPENNNFMDRVKKINYFDPSVYHDRVIVVNEQKFHVQSGLLSTWSEYFCTLFNSDFKEKNQDEIEINDLDPSDFTIFLNVIYPGRFVFEEMHIEPLITLAYRFLAPGVLDKCKEFIERDFEKLDQMLLLQLATTYSIQDIKVKSMEFLLTDDKFVDLVDGVELLKFACKNDLKLLKDKVVEFLLFKNNYRSVNIIKLLQCSFEFDLEPLKKLIRSVIHVAPDNQWRYKCEQCPDRVQKQDCTHKEMRSTPINRNSFLLNNLEKILPLSTEIKDFIFESLVDYQYS